MVCKGKGVEKESELADGDRAKKEEGESREEPNKELRSKDLSDKKVGKEDLQRRGQSEEEASLRVLRERGPRLFLLL